MGEQLTLNVVKFPKDAYIVILEDTRVADRFFIIREGKVHISKEMQVVAEEQGDILGPGDFFGVVSTMSGHSHIETARALTDVVLVAVRQEQFGQLIQNNIAVAIKILLQFSRQIRHHNEALSILTLKKSTDATIDYLFDIAEYHAKQHQYRQAYYAYCHYIKYCPNGENIQSAREKIKKITPYAKGVKLVFEAHEMNRTYQKNDMIFAEGEPGEEFFIIKSGSVKIAKVTNKNEILLAVLKAGDIFGEMALLESKPRTACATANEICQLMVVNRTNFDQMIKTQPQLIARLTAMLADRIWLSFKQLANTRISDPPGRIYDMLLIQLENKRVDLAVKTPCMFDFGGDELIHMVGFSQSDGSMALHKLLENKYVEIVHEKLCVKNVYEFARQASYYRKKLAIEETRKERL
jgi:CRP-like cAMP-binding protein